MSYKVGDKVICIKPPFGALYIGRNCPILGKLFTIIKVRTAYKVLYHCSGCEHHDLVFYEEEITLATPLMEELL